MTQDKEAIKDKKDFFFKKRGMSDLMKWTDECTGTGKRKCELIITQANREFEGWIVKTSRQPKRMYLNIRGEGTGHLDSWAFGWPRNKMSATGRWLDSSEGMAMFPAPCKNLQGVPRQSALCSSWTIIAHCKLHPNVQNTKFVVFCEGFSVYKLQFTNCSSQNQWQTSLLAGLCPSLLTLLVRWLPWMLKPSPLWRM